MENDSTSLPDHLSDGPTFDETEFLFDDFDIHEVAAVHDAVARLISSLDFYAHPDATRYFILGNYDEPQKRRLRSTANMLERYNPCSTAVLLEDLDPTDDYWENFYLKFRYTLTITDYVVLVAEDNDGGHELEFGEVPLENTYVVKRNYTSASIGEDLEREKYDAMMAKLCNLMDRNNRLFEWTSAESFVEAVKSVASKTR